MSKAKMGNKEEIHEWAKDCYGRAEEIRKTFEKEGKDLSDIKVIQFFFYKFIKGELNERKKICKNV